MKKILEFLNSRLVILLMLAIVLTFFVNWSDLGILDYVVITTTTIYVLLLVIRLILGFIKKRL